MSDPQQAKFDGWAIVDVLGHQRYVGYVTTEAYGQAVLFRIDVPALDARERVTKAPGYINERGYCPAGTTVQEGAVPGYTKLIGSGSIYAITPCTKEAALEERLSAFGRGSIRPFLHPDDPLLRCDANGVRVISDEEIALIKAITPNKWGRKIELHDPMRGAELVAKLTGLLKDTLKVEHTLEDIVAGFVIGGEARE